VEEGEGREREGKGREGKGKAKQKMVETGPVQYKRTNEWLHDHRYL